MRRERSSTHPGAKQPRPRRRIHDPGRGGAAPKLPDLARCPECEACYREGRWTWQPAPADAYEHVCPACVRIRDGDPAGILQIHGAFAASHRGELTALLRHTEEREASEHPLNRILSIEDEEDGFAVKTTEAKLAHTLGRALHKAYAGELQDPGTTEPGSLVRLRWSRD